VELLVLIIENASVGRAAVTWVLLQDMNEAVGSLIEL